MYDNTLRISFEYKKPDEAVLAIYTVIGSRIDVVRADVGEKAIAIYSELSGKTIEQIEKEAECDNG